MVILKCDPSLVIASFHGRHIYTKKEFEAISIMMGTFDQNSIIEEGELDVFKLINFNNKSPKKKATSVKDVQ